MRQNFLRALFWGSLLVLTRGAVAPAADFSGTLATSVYSFERITSTEEIPQSRGNQTFTLFANDLTSGRGGLLSGHMFLRFRTDWQNALPGDPQWNFYNLYFDYRTKSQKLAARVGRQFVTAGWGATSLDGAKISVRPIRNITVQAFGGSAIDPLNPQKVRPLARNEIWGGYLAWDWRFKAHLGFSLFQKNFERSKDRYLIGADGRYDFGRVSFLARANYDYDRTSALFQRFFPLRLKKLQLLSLESRQTINPQFTTGLEYFFHRPLFSARSFMTRFSQSTYHDWRTSGNYFLTPKIELQGEMGWALLEKEEGAPGSDNAFRLRLGVAASDFAFGYVRRSGYAGSSDGVYARFAHQLRRWLLLSGSFDFSQYAIQPAEDETQATSAALSVDFRPWPDWSLLVQYQNLTNVRFSNDNRLFARAAYNFRF